MMSVVKKSLWFALTAVLCFSLSAGGQKEMSGSETEKKLDKEVSFYHDNPEWQANWARLGKASGSDIDLALSPTEFETTIYVNRIKVDLVTKRAAPLFKWWFGYRAKELVDAGLLKDLGPLWDKVESNYPEGVRDAMSIDGFTYGIPLHVNYWVWYYSKAALAKVGKEVPETWADFTEILELSKKQGISGIGNTIGKSRWTSFIVFQELLMHSDADLYKDLMEGRAHYTDPGVVKVMELWKDLLDKGYFAPMDATYPEDFPSMLKDGSLAFAPFGDWYGGILADQGLVPGEDYGAFILPAITPAGKGAVALEISPLCVGEKSENANEALAWLEWYSTSETAAQSMWDIFKFAPTGNISAATIEKEDPVKASIGTLAKDSPKKIVRFWEATPVGIVETAVDEFNLMLSDPDEYMNILKKIESKAKQVWPDFGVDY